MRPTIEGGFRVWRVPFLFYACSNMSCDAGHARIFGDEPGRGFLIHSWNSWENGWARHRVWNFGLFAIHHVSPGKSTRPNGWYIRFAKLKLRKIHLGLSLTWQWADHYQ